MADRGPDKAFTDPSPVHWRAAMGMVVVGADGTNVGQVKAVRDAGILVDRPLARDVYIPYGACQAVEDNRVVLRIRAEEVDAQGWRNPAPGDNPLI